MGSSLRAASAQAMSVASCENVGPLVNDGASYIAIGEIKLHIVSNKLIRPPSITLSLKNLAHTIPGSTDQELKPALRRL